MAAFIDDFDDDPFAARWTQEMGSAAYDSTDDEIDVSFTGSHVILSYLANGPGSIEHEAQVTAIAGDDRVLGPAVRIDGAGPDAYTLDLDDDDNLRIRRIIAGGTEDVISNQVSGVTFTVGNWYTLRLAAAGGVGSNVALSAWVFDHGTSKPSLGGSGNWQGVDASPHITATDTEANRLDGASHANCGIGGRSASNADYDTRLDFWKERAISDRGGVGPTLPWLPRQTNLHGPTGAQMIPGGMTPPNRP